MPLPAHVMQGDGEFLIDGDFGIALKGYKEAQLGEDESYHLEISTTDVQLTAPNPIGVLRGLQTFLQLVTITPRGFSVPVVTIDDKPRYPWRGLLIDSGHRFVPFPAPKRNLL